MEIHIKSTWMYSGWTALHHAAAGGHADCVKALGEAGQGALIDLRTWEVIFLFFLEAAWLRTWEVISLFLEAGKMSKHWL